MSLATNLRTGIVSTLELTSLFAAGGALAWLGWNLLEPTGPVSNAPLPSPTSSYQSDLAKLSQTTDPFSIQLGAINQSAPVSSAPSAEGITLHATRAMSDGYGTAILSTNDIPQTSVRIGDKIGDAELVEVKSREVELIKNGRRIRIAFPETTSNIITSNARPQTAQQTPASSAMLASVALKSVQRSNGSYGFEIVPRGTNQSVLRQAGLMSGDIVLGVNGAPLNTQNIADYRSQIMSGAPVELKVERNGKILTTRLGEPK